MIVVAEKPHDAGLPAPPDKPCAVRLPPTTPRGCVRWCILDHGHDGDHEGVTERELPASGLVPRWKPGWGK